MRLTARLPPILISSEEFQSKRFQIPVPNDPTDPFESHPTPLHSSHKHLDLSLWKLTSFPESPYIPHSASSCQMCYLSGNCWNFPDRFYAKGKKYLSHQCAHTALWDWQYLGTFHTLQTRPHTFSPCITKYCSLNTLWKMSLSYSNYWCQHPRYCPGPANISHQICTSTFCKLAKWFICGKHCRNTDSERHLPHDGFSIRHLIIILLCVNMMKTVS